MTLPLSGQIGLGDINVELGRRRDSQISLDTAENGGYGRINQSSRTFPSATNPAAVSEWRGYDHNASTGPVLVGFSYEYTNESASTLPFELWINGLLTVSRTSTGIGLLEASEGSLIRVRVRENNRRFDWQWIMVAQDGNVILYELIDDSVVDITFPLPSNAGGPITIQAGNTNNPPFF